MDIEFDLTVSPRFPVLTPPPLAAIAPSMARRKSRKMKCPLTTSRRKRAAADRLAASVQDGFPPGLSQPALRALAGAGYTNLAQLAGVSEAELLQLHGLGPKAIDILRAALQGNGVWGG